MNFTLPAGANSTSVNYKVINDYGAVSDVQSASL